MVDFDGLKISFIAGTLGKGGAERQLYYMARALRQCGARPRVFCFRKGEYWESALVESGVPVTCVGKSRLERVRGILRELRADRPDILQSAHFYTNGYAQIAARILGLREIGAIRCDLVSELSGSHAWLRRMSLSTLRAVAANSRAAIRTAARFGLDSEKLRFLPNVVDTTRFRPAPRDAALPICLLGAGRLTPQKRFDRFLRIAARVKKLVNQPIRIRIAGDGPLRTSLEATAAELGFRDGDVQFSGLVDDMSTLYREATIFLLTSAYEGTPNVVLEAMASGLPVVSTSVGDVPDLITDGANGFLAGPDDEDRMAERLERLVREPELRDRVGRAAREHIEANHSVRNLPHYLNSLYGGVLQYESAFVAHR